MQGSISLEVLAAVSENSFSLDELILRIRELADREGLAGLAGFILGLVDQKLCRDLVGGKGASCVKPCCQRPHYDYQDFVARQFRTSVGLVKIRWRRLRCSCCGRSIIPLRQFLGLEPYQSRTNELQKMVTEVVSEQSYRRSSDHLRRIGEIPVPRSTLHRWVVTGDCDRIESRPQKVDVLIADGTGYKRRPGGGKDNRGEIELALGICSDGRIKPLGAWSNRSWISIGDELIARHGPGPMAQVLVSDGQQALVSGLQWLAYDKQRCHWHAARDLYGAMHEDGADLSQKYLAKKELAGIIRIRLPKEDFEQVRDQDKAALENSMREAQCKLSDFAGKLFRKGYYRAANYVRRTQDNLFTYVRSWLASGLVCPRASSMIERMMREIGRRLKRIAFGWSEQGAAQMTRIIIKRITSPQEWEAFWNKRLNISGNVILAYRGIRLLPQTLGR